MALASIARTVTVIRVSRLTKLLSKLTPETSLKDVRVFAGECFSTKANEPEASGKAIPERNASLKPKVHKPLTSPQITLVLPEEKVMSVTLEHAEKMAKRRDLKLVKIIDFDTKTERPVYKLMTKLEYFEEDAKSKEKKKRSRSSAIKDAKLFTISSKISENDLQSKIRQIFKLMKKMHEIKIYVAVDGNQAKADEVTSSLQQELKELTSKEYVVKKQSTIKLHFFPKFENQEQKDTLGKTKEES